jgi:hypothetical protein
MAAYDLAALWDSSRHISLQLRSENLTIGPLCFLCTAIVFYNRPSPRTRRILAVDVV